MQIAFCLYKYFPYGGLQRDFLRIATTCHQRGHTIRVYTLEWEGEQPAAFEVVIVPAKGFSNIRRYKYFSEWVKIDLQNRPVDRVVGFNKMPNLDVYYAADPCYEEKSRKLRKPWYRLSARYRHFSAYERAVFGPEAKTVIMSISPIQRDLFIHYYGTQRERIHDMPPGIAPDRRAPPNADEIRSSLRNEFNIGQTDPLLIQVGSDFPRKGLDRSIAALAALPAQLRSSTFLIALGADNAQPFLNQAAQLGIGRQVIIPGPRQDIPRFLLGADILLHPARHENTGTVLLEAIAAGLPIVASAACGYAHHILDAEAGCIVREPFTQTELNQALATLLSDRPKLTQMHRNALRYADLTDLYSLPERAADIILGVS